MSTARDSSEYYTSASIFKSGIKNVHGLRVAVATSHAAEIDGHVSCMKGYDFDSYDFCTARRPRPQRAPSAFRTPVVSAQSWSARRSRMAVP